MDYKLVKNIYDIPGIEELMNEVFEFGSYSLSDNIRSYSANIHDIYENQVIEVCIISEENEVLASETLTDLTTQENISYFSMAWYKLEYNELDHLPLSTRLRGYQWNKNN